MPTLDIIDETFVVAPIDELRATLCDESQWRRLGLNVRSYEDRDELGRRWILSGELEGTAEVWLERAYGGVIVHVFVQADPAGVPGHGRRGWRRRSTTERALRRRYARPLKSWVLDVKRTYDTRRPAGVVPTTMDPTQEG